MSINETTKQLKSAETLVEKLELRVKLGDETKTEALEVAKQTVIDLKVELEEAKFEDQAQQEAALQKMKQKRQTEIEEKASQINVFSLDAFDDPITQCMVIGSIASSLQYQDISGESYLYYLADLLQQETQGTEQSIDVESRLDELKAKREEIHIYRVVIAREFKKAAARVSHEAAYKPRELFRTDVQVRNAEALRQETKAAARRENQENMKEKIRTYAEVIYS